LTSNSARIAGDADLNATLRLWGQAGGGRQAYFRRIAAI
jgi:hypothetical protein